MARFIKDRKSTKGQAPGSLIFIGNQKMKKPTMKLFDYNKDYLNEIEINDLHEFEPYIHQDSVSWLNINGIHEPALIQELGDMLNLHPLLLEDMLNTDEMPKYHDSDNYDAFVLKMITYDEYKNKLYSEQFTLILGHKYVVTLQEQPGDVFDPVRNRIRNKGRVRLNENDYLAYALIDTIVDNYLILIEQLGRNIEAQEVKIFKNIEKDNIAEKIYRFKIELNFLRKSIRPLRDMMNKVFKSDKSFFQEKNESFLLDLNDLVEQATEAIELYTSLVSDQLNIYNAKMGNKMNEVMKVLTIFASIFIPLTFFAGIYGMNFDYMPELNYKYSYPIFWIIMLTLGLGLLWYFKRKRWL